MSIRAECLSVRGTELNGAPRLEDASFELADGTVTILVGATGAGKSTLLDVVAGLTVPSSGTVYMNGERINGKGGGKRDRALLRQAGIVFQQPERQLFAKTVQEEFAYSLRPLKLGGSEKHARIAGALRAMQLPAAVLQANPLRLSGGMKRRVAIASTLAVEPLWLLLDEPTAGLDPESGRHLVGELVAWKKRTAEGGSGGGVIVATHDLDLLLPIADRVLLLSHGRLVADMSPEELAERPELLLEHGVGWPSAWRIGAALRERGLGVELAGLTPEALADAVLERRFAAAGTDQAAAAISVAGVSEEQEPDAAANPLSAQMPNKSQGLVPERKSTQLRTLLQQADPRALWGAYALLTAGVLLQQTWFGTLLSLAMTFALIGFARLPWRPIWRGAKPYIWFTAFAAALAGASLSAAGGAWYAIAMGFSWRSATAALLPLLRLLPALLLGLQLPLVSSHLRMKRGLEWALSRLAWTRLPVEALALASSLLLRFVPLVLGEFERFARIARARGGSRSKPGSLALRDARAVLVPLLLALLQLADDVALALEVRGYSRLGQARTSAVRLRLTRSDVQLLAGAALLFAILMLLRLLSF